jgi:hypothetical protein
MAITAETPIEPVDPNPLPDPMPGSPPVPAPEPVPGDPGPAPSASLGDDGLEESVPYYDLVLD